MTNVYIEHEGKIVFVKNMSCECFMDVDASISRSWFIAKQISKTPSMPMKNIEALSDIWIQKRLLGVEYPPHVEHILSTRACDMSKDT